MLSLISQDSAYFQRDGSDWRDLIQNIQFFPDICPGKNVKNVKKWSFENQFPKILHIFTEIAQIEEIWDKIFRFLQICPWKNVKNVKKWSFGDQFLKILHNFNEMAEIYEIWDKIFGVFLIYVQEKM